jgi:hypothetical protein
VKRSDKVLEIGKENSERLWQRLALIGLSEKDHDRVDVFRSALVVNVLASRDSCDNDEKMVEAIRATLAAFVDLMDEINKTQ